jgi:hypothetical protein
VNGEPKKQKEIIPLGSIASRGMVSRKNKKKSRKNEEGPGER